MKDNKYTVKYPMPLLPDFKNQTALHICFENSEFKAIDIMLKYLQLYNIDHHTRAIADLIPKLIEKSLPEVPAYLASRLTQTAQSASITKGTLRDPTINAISAPIIFDEDAMNTELMDMSDTAVPVKI